MNHYNITIYFTNTPTMTYSGIAARDGAAAKRTAKNFARLENPDGIIDDNKTTVKEV